VLNVPPQLARSHDGGVAGHTTAVEVDVDAGGRGDVERAVVKVVVGAAFVVDDFDEVNKAVDVVKVDEGDAGMATKTEDG